jgi:hypothetical protein
MNARKLLTGLGSPGGPGPILRSEARVSGKGGGTLFDVDFFRLLKKDEGFLVRTGWFSLLADNSVDVRTGLCCFDVGVHG